LSQQKSIMKVDDNVATVQLCGTGQERCSLQLCRSLGMAGSMVLALLYNCIMCFIRDQMDAILRRGERVGLYNGPTITQIIEESDDTLFDSIMYHEQHLLHRLLPERHYTNYSLRSRRHDCTLLPNTDRRNFKHRIRVGSV